MSAGSRDAMYVGTVQAFNIERFSINKPWATFIDANKRFSKCASRRAIPKTASVHAPNWTLELENPLLNINFTHSSNTLFDIE